MNEKAQTTLQEAEIIRGYDVCANSAANRYYFAVLQSIFGFAERTEGYSGPSEKGGNHKYATRIAEPYLDRKQRRIFHTLKGLRTKADYKPSNVLSDDLSDEFIEMVVGVFNIFSVKNSED